MIVKEASTLGLHAGEWPHRINVEKQFWLFQQLKFNGEREVVAGIYKAENGTDELHILND